jgi:hypothetical protein
MARQFTWTPGDGGPPLTFTDRAAGYRVMAAGTTGLSAPPYRVTTATHAGIPGSTLQALQADQRTVTLGLQVEAPTLPEFRARWRALVRAMRPQAGTGILTVTDEYGAARHLDCRYTGGLEGDGDAEFPGTIGRAVVTLTAFDPWFYGPEQAADFGVAAPSVFLSATDPFPRRLSSSTVQGQQTIDLSDADAPTHPVWTVTGPGVGLALTNQTTGRTIQVNITLGDGQTLVIDTRPGHQAVYRGDLPATDPGRNQMRLVASDPALWPLIEGTNDVSAVLGAAGPASRVRGVFRPRYAGI